MKEYDVKHMFRITVIDPATRKFAAALFETKELAEEYKQLMEQQGKHACLNAWQWEVKIEK